MNTWQLYCDLHLQKVTNQKFDGIYAHDTLKDIKSTPQLILYNMDPSTNTHIVVVVVPQPH